MKIETISPWLRISHNDCLHLIVCLRRHRSSIKGHVRVTSVTSLMVVRTAAREPEGTLSTFPGPAPTGCNEVQHFSCNLEWNRIIPDSRLACKAGV